jgi:enolase
VLPSRLLLTHTPLFSVPPPQVLDSRGNPTVEVDVFATVHGAEKRVAREAAPSGASTGSQEALFKGKGVLKAVANVDGLLSDAVKGMDLQDLDALDKAMRDSDGTELKTKAGGNAMCAASFALAAAGAAVADAEVYLHLAKVFHGDAFGDAKYALPRPMVNIVNGGKHAGGNLKLQEFMIVPAGGKPFAESLRHCAEVYHCLGKILVVRIL